MPQPTRVRSAMTNRVRLAPTIAPTAVPDQFRQAYQRGGTPTHTHLAAAAGTTPIWLMTGWPTAHALPAPERTSP